METISLGTPTGRSRIAGVTSAVPPEPPSPRTPPTSSRPARKARSARVIAPTALPRSPVNTASAPSGWQAATSAAVMSGPGLAAPEVDTSTRRTSAPSAAISSATKASSAPLVSNVPITYAVPTPEFYPDPGTRGEGRSSDGAGHHGHAPLPPGS